MYLPVSPFQVARALLFKNIFEVSRSFFARNRPRSFSASNGPRSFFVKNKPRSFLLNHVFGTLSKTRPLGVLLRNIF